MTVFVAYGYLPHERWVHELVVPMLGHLGAQVAGGEEIPGQSIDTALWNHIGAADALIGFLLKRQKNPDGSFTTSEYVQQEINIALGLGKDVVQVVEDGVRAPGGFLAGLQRLEYTLETRDTFLLRLTRHVREWIAGEVYVRLAPDALLQDIEQSVVQPAACEYCITRDGHPGPTRRAAILGLGGGMYVKLLGFSPGTFADVTITANGIRWSSRGVAHSLPFVTVPLARVA